MPVIEKVDDDLLVNVQTAKDQGSPTITGLTNVNEAPSGAVRILKPADEFLVNSTTAGDQLWHSIADLADGGWISIWTSTDQDGSGTGVYAQRYTASGEAAGGEFRINSITSGDQLAPTVAGLPDGGWLATWTSYDPSNPAGDIHAQRYDAVGQAIGVETVINTTTPLMQGMSRISVLADGGWIITWNSEAQDGSGFGIFGQRFSSDGTQIGSEFQVSTYAAGDQTWPEIAALNDGGWVVTWMSDGQDGSQRGVFAQRFGADGSHVGAEFLVNTQTFSFQEAPKITPLADGGWVITWQSYDQDGSWSGIYGQRYAAAGTAIGAEFQINTYTDHQQIDSSVSALADGGWIVAWTSQGQDNPVGGTYTRGGIFGQRYAADGTSVGSEFRINTHTADSQYLARVVGLANGGWIANWVSDNQDGSGTGIYGQQFAANGLPRASAAGSDFTQGQTLYADPSIITDPDGVGSIIWQWQRSADGGANWTDIAGASADSYTLTQADVGDLVRVAARYTDGGGTAEVVYSSASSAVINVNDAPSGALQLTKLATEFRVNTTTVDTQSLPSVTALEDGGWIITWASENQDGSGSGVYAQRYAATGQAINGEFRINSTALGNQTSPIVAALPDGGWLATWTSVDQDGSGGGIYAQRYDVNGNTVGSETLVNTTTASSQEYSAVSVLQDGGWIVNWNSAGQDGSGLGIFGQRFSSNGTALGSEFQVNTYTTSDQWWPASAALFDGGWVITWHSEGQDGSDRGVFAQRYDSNGGAVGAEFLVNTVTASFQETPKITALADGGWVITWQSYGQDGSWSSIHGQRYAASGATVGSEFQANTYTDHQQIDSWVSSLADGGWVVTWVSQGQDDPIGDTFARGGIYSQRYASDGSPVGSEFLVNTKTTDSQFYGRVAGLADGGWVVTWQADNQDGSGFGIYGQRYAANGLAQERASLLSDFTEDRTLYADASLIADPDGVGAITWQWQRSADGGATWGNIAGASAESYNLAQADVGALVRVAASYTDGGGTAEVVYSIASSAVINVNDAPVITSNGGGETATLSILQYSTAVTTATAADVDAGTTLTYSISGGADAALFHIDATTGALSFKNAPNFEAHTDAGANNVYDVVVQGSDGALTDTQAISVTVTNLIEGTSGNDNLVGSVGNDILKGNGGGDILVGGQGDDTFIIDKRASGGAIVGGSGVDTIILNEDPLIGSYGAPATIIGTVERIFDVENIVFNSESGHYILFASIISRNGLASIISIPKLIGGQGIDIILFAGVSTSGSMLLTMPDVQVENWNSTGNSYQSGQLTSDRVRITALAYSSDDVVVSASEANGLAGLVQALSFQPMSAAAFQAKVTLLGSSGQDNLSFSGGIATLSGAAGDDILVIANAAPVIDGANLLGPVTEFTGAGSLFDGGSGKDTLSVGGHVDLKATLHLIETVYLQPAGSLPGPGGWAQADALLQVSGENWANLPGNLEIDGTGVIEVSLSPGDAFHGSGYQFLTGADVQFTVNGSDAADVIVGTINADHLNGNAGNDVLNGGTGNDMYYVDSAGDNVIEGATGGTADIVYASTSYSLAGRFVEVLTLTGTANINATGNSQAQTLNGNSGNNTLLGLQGVDRLNGGAGTDTLEGGSGNDTLDGGSEADAMRGGTENDTYYVDNVADVVTESVNEGTDTVFSSANYSLAGRFVEVLTLTGTANINATGNSQAQTLNGNAGNNTLLGLQGNDVLNGGARNDTLDGGTGKDTMRGGLNDDTYYIDDVTDVVTEAANEGTDTIFSSVTYSLAGRFVEVLTLTGSANINATGNSQTQTLNGNAGNNTLIGLAGNDTLNGKLGADILNGGTGKDLFVFDTALGGGNIDAIQDFNVVDDQFQLARSIFMGLAAGSTLSSAEFYTGSAANDSSDRIIYDSATGALYFDADGNGAGSQIQFASLATSLALTNADFLLI
ncbi:hypothetical protein [Novosphingobium sp.]|uniref:beta strand repeat-containing protein n=1 Tax=Novosphingobium sp. TaxID=1874826 RepID=UPI0026327CB7|nr:hypothetical protein [Novosphingobium sp.]